MFVSREWAEEIERGVARLESTQLFGVYANTHLELLKSVWYLAAPPGGEAPLHFLARAGTVATIPSYISCGPGETIRLYASVHHPSGEIEITTSTDYWHPVFAHIDIVASEHGWHGSVDALPGGVGGNPAIKMWSTETTT